jgi:low temperature requirement protein LtrA
VTAPASPASRVTTLELFFDLVFVFTITQTTTLLADDLTLRGFGRVVLLLAVILWMYGGYAWLTNAVPPVTRARRTLILVGMGSFLAMALAVPEAFGDTGWLFGLGYFVVNAVHSGLFLTAGRASAPGMRVIGPTNLASATLVLVGGFAPLGWRYGLWIAAVLLFLVSPLLRSVSDFAISPEHFVERHGLIIIIALGESIVAIGVGLAGEPINPSVILVAVLALSLAYLMYWVYFGVDQSRAEHALSGAAPSDRARLALSAYAWAHYVLILGIVVIAAGVKKAVGHAVEHLTIAEALTLGGGLAIYVLGETYFRRTLRLGAIRFRVLAAFVAVATVPLGFSTAALQLFALNLVLMGMFVIEVMRGVETMPA